MREKNIGNKQIIKSFDRISTSNRSRVGLYPVTHAAQIFQVGISRRRVGLWVDISQEHDTEKS